MSKRTNTKKQKNKTSKHIYVILAIAAIIFSLYQSRNQASYNIPNDRYELPVTPQNTPQQYIEHSGFSLSFNKKTNNPNWVAWKLDKEKLIERESRTNNFLPDPNIPEEKAVTTKDYSGSGWDRGHMCPAADCRWHWKAMQECFYMTNICPQNHKLNSGDWKELEEACREWAKKETIYIVAGPIMYKESKQEKIGKEHKIEIPDAFFKVVLAGIESDQPRAIGFIFENKAESKKLDAYAKSIDEVESISGYDFFSTLPDEIENDIESGYNYSLWKYNSMMQKQYGKRQ